jgi:prepilin-type N-terminal cleavage/methylation domain-containing protein
MTAHPARAEAGFTIVEVLIAVVVLAVGIVALVGSTASSTRMIGRGRTATRAVQAATERMEMLRADAYRTSPDCTALADGSDSASTGIVTTWTITGTGSPRTVRVISSYRVPGRLRADTLSTQIRCAP